QQLDKKMLAITTLEEMDQRIDKVGKSFSAMLPKQQLAADQQVTHWQQEFQLSASDMIEFNSSMLEPAVASERPEQEQANTAVSSAFDEQTIVERANRTAHAIDSIKGFAETAEYLKRKAARLDKQEFTIALFGAFSAGKSSFSNAL